LRDHAVEQRGHLSVCPSVVPFTAEDGGDGQQVLVAPAELVVQVLAAPEDEPGVATPVVELVDVLPLGPVCGPGIEARRDAAAVAAAVKREEPPHVVLVLAEVPLANG